MQVSFKVFLSVVTILNHCCPRKKIMMFTKHNITRLFNIHTASMGLLFRDVHSATNR
jgi:hypothetical protein